MTAQDAALFERIAQHIEPHSRVRERHPLTGGISAQVTVMRIESPSGAVRDIVVRQHGPVDLARNQNVAADEFALLQALRRAGVAVPEPLAFETSPDAGQSFVATSHVPGATTIEPAEQPDYVRALAAQLHAIHNVTLDDALAARLPAFALRMARTLAQPSMDNPICRRIHQTLALQTPPAIDRLCLLHGDLWPGNVLWQAGRITAVLDWEDAAIGHPLADVANCRLELLWAFGPEAMRAFTQHYAECDAAVNMAHLPVHDLCAAVGPALNMSTWGLAPRREADMRAVLAAFIDAAIASLS